MKKTILVAVVLFAMSNATQAQLVKFGIKAGLNYANQNGSDITVNSTNYETDAITSYHAGLVVEATLTDSFSIQPELLYSTQGATYKSATTEFKNKLGYLAIPVMAKVHLNKSVSLELGPQASFLLSEKDKFNAEDSETFDFSAAMGIGLKVTNSIFIQGRYVLGLTEVSKESQVKNSVLQISAGILF
jgi:hypothetical protein